MIKINVTMEFSEEWLESVVCSALEGGSNYWIDDFNVAVINNNVPKEERLLSISDKITRSYSEILLRDEEDVIEEGRVWTINRETFITGYKRYCELNALEGYKLYTDASDIDGNEADVILQLGLFNGIIFG